MTRTTTQLLADTLVAQPWSTHSEDVSMVGKQGRPCLLTRDDVEQVRVETTGETLPLLAQWTDERRFTWRKFELPATGTPGQVGPAVEELALRLITGNGRRRSLRLELQRGLPRPGGVEDRDPSELLPADPHWPADAWHEASFAAERMYDQHIDFVESMCDPAAADPDQLWDDRAGGVTIWPAGRLLHAWQHQRHRRGPRPPLIVSLAAELGSVLRAVCRRPRRFLKRERAMQSAARIGEVDATCLRWLARQPGMTVAQKVGVNQQALGIQRVESADSLENRVVRDLMRRARRACERFMAAHRFDLENSQVSQVAEFAQLLDRLWRETPIAHVAPLATPPKPNHVLQRDQRYRKLYRAYVQLLNQQWQQEQAWRWRSRVWVELCQLAMLSAMARIEPTAAALKSPVLMRTEQRCGRFIDERTALGRWDLRGDQSGLVMWWVDGRQLTDFAAAMPRSLPESLIRLAPDAVVICADACRPDQPPLRILAMWSVFDFDVDDDRLEARCRQIDQGMRMVSTQTPLAGLLVQPQHPQSSRRWANADLVSIGRVQARRLALPVQTNIELFQQVLAEAVLP